MTLHMTIGLPYSGKSTWARAQGHPIVCPDAIRLALHGQRFEPRAEAHVWAIAHTMVSALFEAGHEDVILDACSTSRERRDEWVGNHTRKFVWFDATAEVCIERARAALDEEIVPVIERMAQAYELPSADERFSKEPPLVIGSAKMRSEDVR